MKKLIVLLLALTLTACAAPEKSETAETITIRSLNANGEAIETEVPYDPQRIAVLDMAALDILDTLGLGERIVGSAQVSIDYLAAYNPNDVIENLGTIKTADLEKVAVCDPDIIFIGGRLASIYADLEAIAPVVYLGVDYKKGVVESTRENARTIASLFGLEGKVNPLLEEFQPRIDALKNVLEGKNVLLGMYNASALSLMDTESQLNIIARELGTINLGESIGEAEKATHGEEASWETIITLNPEYMFVLDRSTATGASDAGVREVIENELIQGLDVYREGRIVYFVDNANVWYTATGGLKALDTMLGDLERALLP